MLGMAEAAALEYDLTVPMLKGRTQERDLTKVRHGLMYAMHRKGYSVSEIGRFLDRDRTTVLYGIRRHKERMKEQAK